MCSTKNVKKRIHSSILPKYTLPLTINLKKGPRFCEQVRGEQVKDMNRQQLTHSTLRMVLCMEKYSRDTSTTIR